MKNIGYVLITVFIVGTFYSLLVWQLNKPISQEYYRKYAEQRMKQRETGNKDLEEMVNSLPAPPVSLYLLQAQGMRGGRNDLGNCCSRDSGSAYRQAAC